MSLPPSPAGKLPTNHEKNYDKNPLLTRRYTRTLRITRVSKTFYTVIRHYGVHFFTRYNVYVKVFQRGFHTTAGGFIASS